MDRASFNAPREDPGEPTTCDRCKKRIRPVYHWGFNSWVIADWRCGC